MPVPPRAPVPVGLPVPVPVPVLVPVPVPVGCGIGIPRAFSDRDCELSPSGSRAVTCESVRSCHLPRLGYGRVRLSSVIRIVLLILWFCGAGGSRIITGLGCGTWKRPSYTPPHTLLHDNDDERQRRTRTTRGHIQIQRPGRCTRWSVVAMCHRHGHRVHPTVS